MNVLATFTGHPSVTYYLFYQVLRNTVVGGRVLDLPEKKCYEDVRFNDISVTTRWVSHCQKKVLRNT